MPDITKGKTFVSGETVTATELNSLVDDATINSLVVDNAKLAANAVDNSKVSVTAAIDYTKLATLTGGNVLVGNSDNQAASVTMSGNMTVSNTGVATIADNAVTPAKLEDGTQGDILYYGASGAPARLGAGTDGQVLKSGGAAADPAWSSGAGTMLGHSHYDPSTRADLTFGTSYADLDTTNIAVTFTAPPSGSVLLKAHLTLNLQGDASSGLFLSLHDGSSTITDSGRTVARPSISGGGTETGMYASTSVWKLTGLSGAKTLTVQGKIYATGLVEVAVGGDAGPFVIEVIEL